MRIDLQSFAHLLQRFVDSARHEQPARERIVQRQRQRIEVARMHSLGDALVKSPHVHQIAGVPVMSPGITWVEFQGALVFPLRHHPVPFMSFGNECQRCVSLGERVVYFDGFPCCRLGA